MKIRMKFSGFGNYSKEEIVEYAGTMKMFPGYGTYDGRYWGAQFFDDDESGAAKYILLLSEHTKEALPCDINGVMFPVISFEEKFNINRPPPKDAVCECGAKFSSFPNNHMTICPKWSKE